MRKTKRTKVRAKMFVLGLCIVGLVFVGSTRTVSVKATSCDDAYNAYYTADNAYDTARINYFYGSPSCADDCATLWPQGGADYTQCVSDCDDARHTVLDTADLDLFSKALETCTPASPDECDAARAAAAACIDQYNYLDYSDTEARLAVYDQYAACRLASKIDTCQ